MEGLPITAQSAWLISFRHPTRHTTCVQAAVGLRPGRSEARRSDATGPRLIALRIAN